MQIRLEKYLADSGFGTRSQVKKIIKQGNVFVNGVPEKDGSRRVDTDADEVVCNGKKVGYCEYEYYLLYKPAGIITASRDKTEKTVVDMIESKKRRDLFPVGRLDRDTEGLLLITNDGKLSHELLAPGKHVDKEYIALIEGIIPDYTIERFREGVDIGDEELTKPAELVIYEKVEDTGDDRIKEKYIEITREMNETGQEKNISAIRITITEGRYHEIKRMFEVVGCKVVYLKRISMGKLNLPADMDLGEYIKIDKSDIVS
ncbi:MAG: rRNA pseudouridine synthase [Eubacterium sp.]|nr:rRNA pseudouridine synthase [Eubacterium sp.]